MIRRSTKYNVLRISGGGSYGAYTSRPVERLDRQRPATDVRYRKRGQRGALIATYAFLGPQYNGALHDFYTQTTTGDIYRSFQAGRLVF